MSTLTILLCTTRTDHIQAVYIMQRTNFDTTKHTHAHPPTQPKSGMPVTSIPERITRPCSLYVIIAGRVINYSSITISDARYTARVGCMDPSREEKKVPRAGRTNRRADDPRTRSLISGTGPAERVKLRCPRVGAKLVAVDRSPSAVAVRACVREEGGQQQSMWAWRSSPTMPSCIMYHGRLRSFAARVRRRD